MRTAALYGAVPPPPSVQPKRPALVKFIAGVLTLVLVAGAVIWWSGLHRRRTASEAENTVAGKLAVCYSGEVRELVRVYEQNVAAFRAFDRRATFFAFIDLHDIVPLPSGAAYERNHSVRELSPVWNAMKAHPVYYSGAGISVPPRPSCVVAAVGGSERHYPHHFHDLRAAAKCFALVRGAERKRKHRFLWILHVRPGMFVDIRAPPPGDRRVHLAGYDAALVPRHAAHTFFSAHNAFRTSSCQRFQKLTATPCIDFEYMHDSTDCLIAKWLIVHRITPTNGVYVKRRIVRGD